MTAGMSLMGSLGKPCRGSRGKLFGGVSLKTVLSRFGDGREAGGVTGEGQGC
jgi:hypothetical protein